MKKTLSPVLIVLLGTAVWIACHKDSQPTPASSLQASQKVDASAPITNANFNSCMLTNDTYNTTLWKHTVPLDEGLWHS